jgi:hypothetical protein
VDKNKAGRVFTYGMSMRGNFSVSLREMPDHFVCATCGARQLLDLLCWDASTMNVQSCLTCCGCLLHHAADPGGRVVWTARQGWRGLDDSESRARRHR